MNGERLVIRLSETVPARILFGVAGIVAGLVAIAWDDLRARREGGDAR